MKLIELEPRWLEHAGAKVAVMFLCPHCISKERVWLTCFAVPSGSLPRVADDFPVEYLRGSRGAWGLFYDALKAMGSENPERDMAYVVGCKADIAWNFSSFDFETMSVTPSLDASESGHWHGFITNGNIV